MPPLPSRNLSLRGNLLTEGKRKAQCFPFLPQYLLICFLIIKVCSIYIYTYSMYCTYNLYCFLISE